MLITLQDRAIIEISGDDNKKFLQGLITNDINKLREDTLLYSAMLNAQGRFLYDFFIFEKDQKLFIDCAKLRLDEIIKKFTFYKLKAKISIVKNDEMLVAVDVEALKNGGFFDPRNKKMGKRFYIAKSELLEEKNAAHISEDETEYHYRRICLKIAEGEHDLTYEKSIIAEFDFDNLNAIDYQKGCYIGQELTARTHFMGQIRKKLFHVKISGTEKITKNCEISCEGNSVGVVLSSVFYKNELHALALIKNPEENALGNYFVNEITPLRIIYTQSS